VEEIINQSFGYLTDGDALTDIEHEQRSDVLADEGRRP
jgi:hypothetical protein